MAVVKVCNYLSMICGCILTSCLAITPAAAMASVLFVGELQRHQATGTQRCRRKTRKEQEKRGGHVGLRMLCLGTFVAGVYLSLFSRVPNMQLSSQLVIAPQLSGIVTSLSQQLSPGNPERFLVHFVLCLGFVAIINGVLFWAVGRFKLAMLVQALPFPVVTGFLAFTGVVIVSNGIELATGAGITELPELEPQKWWLLLAPFCMVPTNDTQHITHNTQQHNTTNNTTNNTKRKPFLSSPLLSPPLLSLVFFSLLSILFAYRCLQSFSGCVHDGIYSRPLQFLVPHSDALRNHSRNCSFLHRRAVHEWAHPKRLSVRSAGECGNQLHATRVCIGVASRLSMATSRGVTCCYIT